MVSVCAALFAASVVSLHAQAPERIVEIRVHGNHTTPDEDVITLSGLRVGEPATDERLRDAGAMLRASHRFAWVDVLRRYLSISDPSQILVMLVVEEKAGVSDRDLTPGIARRIRANQMWLPILNYTDGYGFTYGARTSFVNPIGRDSRISLPLSWGGERRAGVDLEKNFGPALHLVGGVAEYRRVNPFYEESDRRFEGRVRAEHPFTSWLRAGVETRIAQVTFGGLDDGRHDVEGVDVTIDTRVDASFPRNAVDATIGIDRVGFGSGSTARRRADLRGYAGLGGSRVLVLRGQFVTSATPLPPSEQSLLGGVDSLRGYRAGHRAGDNLMALSLELRQPINSPLTVGRFGLRAFVDEGTTWNVSERRADRPLERGVGAGIYFGGGPVIGTFDVAWPQHGSARVHFGLGLSL